MHKPLYQTTDTPAKELASLVFYHFGKAPMGWTGIDKLTEYAHNEQFVQRVLDLYAYLQEHNGFLDDINPSQYYKIIYKFQLASKSSFLDVQLIDECYLFLANYSVRLYNHNMDDICAVLPTMSFIFVQTQAEARRVAILSALLRSYSETLYCDEHTIAGEIYSPIEMNGDTWIVHKYIMLDAVALREELRDCPIRKVNIYMCYHGLTQVPTTDIVGNLLITENILPKLIAYRVETEDTQGDIATLSPMQIDALITYFDRIIPLLVNNYKQLNIQDRLWMKVLCEYYALKPYCDDVGIDWHPTPYSIDVNTISSLERPIVRANEELAFLSDGESILEKLFELNNPKVHW